MKAHQPPLIILSGAYCSADIAAEFGELPPSFLPVCGQRLYQRQIKLAQGSAVFLSVPSDYILSHSDVDFLQKNNMRVLRVPRQLSLVTSMQLVLEMAAIAGPVKILFGDTLIDGEEACPDDSFATQTSLGYYRWSYCEVENDRISFTEGMGDGQTKRDILVGYFVFSDAECLRQSLIGSQNLPEALGQYHRSKKLTQVTIKNWYDFGHLNLFFQSIKNLAVSRAFNHITSDGMMVTKSSEQSHKMKSEILWYRYLPDAFKLYTPRFMGEIQAEEPGYRLEYLYFPLVSELYAFGTLPKQRWRKILASCFDFLSLCHATKPRAGAVEANEEFSALYFKNVLADKTRHRLRDYAAQAALDLHQPLRRTGGRDVSLQQVCDDVLRAIPPTTPADICLSHGDFFFGNIFYDVRAERVQVIDPRGFMEAGPPTFYGDARYDLAKLAHSVIGQYDRILAGRCTMVDGVIDLQDEDIHPDMEKDFWAEVQRRTPYHPRDILAMT
ncbi:MAG: hypothetical protein EB121_02760, partial [Alphaproteobacteria bacterium]|nr:hypothetical protein [Alphaproteobacteria bacterium]